MENDDDNVSETETAADTHESTANTLENKAETNNETELDTEQQDKDVSREKSLKLDKLKNILITIAFHDSELIYSLIYVQSTCFILILCNVHDEKIMEPKLAAFKIVLIMK